MFHLVWLKLDFYIPQEKPLSSYCCSDTVETGFHLKTNIIWTLVLRPVRIFFYFDIYKKGNMQRWAKKCYHKEGTKRTRMTFTVSTGPVINTARKAYTRENPTNYTHVTYGFRILP